MKEGERIREKLKEKGLGSGNCEKWGKNGLGDLKGVGPRGDTGKIIQVGVTSASRSGLGLVFFCLCMQYSVHL